MIGGTAAWPITTRAQQPTRVGDRVSPQRYARAFCAGRNNRGHQPAAGGLPKASKVSLGLHIFGIGRVALLNRLYERRLIEALDPNVKTISGGDKVTIEESGLAHNGSSASRMSLPISTAAPKYSAGWRRQRRGVDDGRGLVGRGGRFPFGTVEFRVLMRGKGSKPGAKAGCADLRSD
jgi:hypothetical protein